MVTIKKISLILGVILSLAAVFTLLSNYECSIAKADDIEMVREEIANVDMKVASLEKKVAISELEQELLLVNQKMFAIEDRWSPKFKEEYGRPHASIEELLAFMPLEYRNQYRDLVAEKAEIKDKIKKLKEN